ncbi:hypothetical protein J2D73_16535 [Acetobacter sacchari]|uniref:Flagellar assembly protein FliH/Type III secretion system HrpE domain-containing protein n=1 Tax=Acetobacter sacchari TaxID=2661687 RepID=A0ABS3LZN9_9PROT|nr:hypothetical protein [Acetobacter sacchari]MBO1361393.1 hypothetical protein [Acetobacter sacchari]
MRIEYIERPSFDKFTYGEDFSEVISEQSVVEDEIEEEKSGDIPAAHQAEIVYSQEYLDQAISDAVTLANTKILEKIAKNQKCDINYSIKKINEKIHKLHKFSLGQIQMYSESISRSLLDSFFAIFPVSEDVVAADVVIGICGKVLPLLENNFKVTVTINSLTFDAIMERDETLKISQFPWLTVEKSMILGPSDIEITWPDGHLIRNVKSTAKDILTYILDSTDR